MIDVQNQALLAIGADAPQPKRQRWLKANANEIWHLHTDRPLRSSSHIARPHVVDQDGKPRCSSRIDRVLHDGPSDLGATSHCEGIWRDEEIPFTGVDGRGL